MHIVSSKLSPNVAHYESPLVIAYLNKNCEEAIEFFKLRFHRLPESLSLVISREDADRLGFKTIKAETSYDNLPFDIIVKEQKIESRMMANSERYKAVFYCTPVDIFLPS